MAKLITSKKDQVFVIKFSNGSYSRKTYTQLSSIKTIITRLAKRNDQYANAEIIAIDFNSGKSIIRIKQGYSIQNKDDTSYFAPIYEDLKNNENKQESNIIEDLSKI